MAAEKVSPCHPRDDQALCHRLVAVDLAHLEKVREVGRIKPGCTHPLEKLEEDRRNNLSKAGNAAIAAAAPVSEVNQGNTIDASQGLGNFSHDRRKFPQGFRDDEPQLFEDLQRHPGLLKFCVRLRLLEDALRFRLQSKLNDLCFSLAFCEDCGRSTFAFERELFLLRLGCLDGRFAFSFRLCNSSSSLCFGWSYHSCKQFFLQQ